MKQQSEFRLLDRHRRVLAKAPIVVTYEVDKPPEYTTMGGRHIGPRSCEQLIEAGLLVDGSPGLLPGQPQILVAKTT